jgi:hypothetical protein
MRAEIGFPLAASAARYQMVAHPDGVFRRNQTSAEIYPLIQSKMFHCFSSHSFSNHAFLHQTKVKFVPSRNDELFRSIHKSREV